MKFVISFFFCLSAFASPIRFFHEGDYEGAKIYQEILAKDYQIPGELIMSKQIQKCEEMKSEGKLDLCLKNNGDLYVVSVDHEFINESLKVFLAP
jgi:hypothetical protein